MRQSLDSTNYLEDWAEANGHDPALYRPYTTTGRALRLEWLDVLIEGVRSYEHP